MNRSAAAGFLLGVFLTGCTAVETEADQKLRCIRLSGNGDSVGLAALCAETEYPSVRRFAVSEITDSDVLKIIADTDAYPPALRCQAVLRIGDPVTLLDVAAGTYPYPAPLRRAALTALLSDAGRLRTLTGFVCDGTHPLHPDALLALRMLLSDRDTLRALLNRPATPEDLAQAALRRVTDEPFLLQLALDPEVPPARRRIALERIRSRALLERFAAESQDPGLVRDTLARLGSPRTVAALLTQTPLRQVQWEAALERLEDEALASDLLCSAGYRSPSDAPRLLALIRSPERLEAAAKADSLPASVRLAALKRLNRPAVTEALFLAGTGPESFREGLAGLLLRGSAPLSDTCRCRLFLMPLQNRTLRREAFAQVPLRLLPETETVQRRIVRALSENDTADNRRRVGNILMFPRAVADLIFEANGPNEELALWALDQMPGRHLLGEALRHGRTADIRRKAHLLLTRLGERSL